MTKQMMWLGAAGIAAASVLATAMVLKPDQSSADSKIADARQVEKPSLLSRITKPRQQMAAVPAGTIIGVRLANSLSTSRNNSGDSFTATLDQDLVIGGKVVAPAGSRATGILTQVVDSGRVEGRARMSMELKEIDINGKSYSLATAPRSFEAQGTKKRDAGIIAGSAAVGAAIGALAGGGKGAAIGAGVGGGSGTGVVLATKGKPVTFGPETRIRFTLTESLQLPVLATAAE